MAKVAITMYQQYKIMRNGEVIRNGSPICDEKERKTCQEGENRQSILLNQILKTSKCYNL